MEKVRLGRSGFLVSKIGFGGIPIQRLSEEDSIEVIRQALDMGVDWVDTAVGYGTSEERVGKAIKGYDRKSLKIFTKGPGKTAGELREQFETSLEKLGCGYIDLYQFHCVGSCAEWREMQENGTVDFLIEMKAKGFIKQIGASSHTLDTMLEVMEHEEISVVQWPFNYIVQEEGLTVLNKCEEKDIGFIAMKPFGGGVLGNAKACIRFLMQYPALALDPGFETVEEVREVVEIVEKGGGLSAGDIEYIEEAKEKIGSRFCRRCGYCTPCPEGVQIITLMTMESLIKRFSAKQVVEGWVSTNVATLEKCTECGECEGKCPYKLPIREQMREGAEMLRGIND